MEKTEKEDAQEIEETSNVPVLEDDDAKLMWEAEALILKDMINGDKQGPFLGDYEDVYERMMTKKFS